MEINIYLPIGLFLLAIILYCVYRNVGYVGQIRRFISKTKLKGKGSQVSAEWLRQNFLLSYPQQRVYDTSLFIKAAKKCLIYKEKTEEYEDGSFIVNIKSPLLKKEDAITYEEYKATEFPDGDGWRN